MKALVMGGGMSGLATAINLLDLGLEVEIIEADDMFGGRASSWLDEDGDMIDNALHVFFPYYVNLVNFFKKLDIDKNIIWKNSEFYFAQEDGKEAVLRFGNLPAPLHAAAAYVSLIKAYTGLPKWKMIFTALGMGMGVSRYSKAQLEELDDITFGMWAMRVAPKGAFKPMEPGINGLTFTPSSMISAKVMINWFKKVSGSAETSRVGFANGGLGEIWVGNCLDYIKGKGGTCELGKAVTAIDIVDGKIEGVTVNGSEKRTADIYVSAISPYALSKLLPDESFKLGYFQDLWHFQYAPSMSLQVWFDRKLTDCEVTYFSNDCIFNTYADLSNVLPHIFKGGTMFEMVLSPADHVQGLPDQVIFDIAIEQIKDRFPVAREAVVKKWKVVRERQGVYRPAPCMEAHRPFQRSPYANFYLTGDYTKTHVSSGGMEAAIWNANKVAELIAADKMSTNVSLNKEFEPNEPLMKLMSPKVLGGGLLAVICLALLRKLFKRR